MKKPEINIQKILKDLDKVLNFVDKIETLDLEKSNLKQLEQESNALKNQLKEKYPDNLDTPK